jgi:hypothetical protein
VRCSHCAACADFGIQHDVEIGLAEPREIGRVAPSGATTLTSMPSAQQPADFGDIVAMAEAERGRAEQLQRGRARARRAPRRRAPTAGQRAHQLIEGLAAPQFSFF